MARWKEIAYRNEGDFGKWTESRPGIVNTSKADYDAGVCELAQKKNGESWSLMRLNRKVRVNRTAYFAA